MTDPQNPTPPFEQPSWQAPTSPNQPTFPQPSAPTPYSTQPGYGAYPGYPQGPYGYPPAEPPQATTILVLGILGLFFAIPGPFALVMGNRARREIAEGRYAPSSSVTIGWVLGIIATIELVFIALAMVLLVIGFAALTVV